MRIKRLIFVELTGIEPSHPQRTSASEQLRKRAHAAGCGRTETFANGKSRPSPASCSFERSIASSCAGSGPLPNVAASIFRPLCASRSHEAPPASKVARCAEMPTRVPSCRSTARLPPAVSRNPLQIDPGACAANEVPWRQTAGGLRSKRPTPPEAYGEHCAQARRPDARAAQFDASAPQCAGDAVSWPFSSRRAGYESLSGKAGRFLLSVQWQCSACACSIL